jgi:hypothetical protein
MAGFVCGVNIFSIRWYDASSFACSIWLIPFFSALDIYMCVCGGGHIYVYGPPHIYIYVCGGGHTYIYQIPKIRLYN